MTRKLNHLGVGVPDGKDRPAQRPQPRRNHPLPSDAPAHIKIQKVKQSSKKVFFLDSYLNTADGFSVENGGYRFDIYMYETLRDGGGRPASRHLRRANLLHLDMHAAASPVFNSQNVQNDPFFTLSGSYYLTNRIRWNPAY